MTLNPTAPSPSSRRRPVAVPALLAALALTAACSNSSGGSGGGGGTAQTLTGDCAKYQPYAGHSGTTVTMFASILSPESDNLEKSWAEFSKCTGIKISYEGSNDFESQLPVRVAGGNAPDFAIIPQPGLLAQMVKSGKVVKPPAQTVTNQDKWSPVWKTYGSVDGTFYAAPMSANMKSLVWYSPKTFAAAGYEVPKTWADLMALSDRIAKAGGPKPWCGGIASGTATGWPATDWLEEVVLGTYGGDVYDQWVGHQVKFSDQKITTAMQTVADWMLNPAWVNGGYGDVKSIATTTFQDAGAPILTGKCAMLQQASFYEAQWPKGTKVAPDGDVFAFHLPAVNPAIANPVEGGGEFLAAFSGRPEVQAVQNYLSSSDWASSRVRTASGWVSANQGVDKSLYTDPIDKLSAEALTDPSATFRFDASDMMPAAIGSGQEWKSLTAWFAEGQSVQKVAGDIDAAWPK
ncbi:ABC transporter substrate-binding protein [Kitasatospora aureofaciens]|uniref:Alpha-glucoside ABC transporter substrate-binding protein n=1 Tax=Kitasatospora aureofaciens TaxID=1894 RepID=A0A1E7N389_KITAU|nr:ABC transporter substrate-binding protein [Kitasatospora aureofaciens]QEU99674.1 carbohydrate ABC transporter substrate-binding protein [Streptomyces viridifaciens]ARF78463.1 sugar ABC transporter substrate-binding protein [Kitasatospora aureofaciens]OEV35135.1 sugar ABC transporter substrate-binding protein [Kitasatospora aureofaciens]UKZ05791.1 ABC transporter substrate-binding protein [Streptomyces viridifaciens]GGU94712.1 alpha-glucoside ABC transporter substrate-binding protein [Kitasa